MRFDILYHVTALIILYVAVENSFHNPFILDDTSKIVKNQDIRQISNMPKSLFYPYDGKLKSIRHRNRCDILQRT